MVVKRRESHASARAWPRCLRLARTHLPGANNLGDATPGGNAAGEG